MKQSLIMLITGCLVLSACGKRKQQYQGEQFAEPTIYLKGTATHKWEGGSLSAPIKEDVVIVPNQGSLNFNNHTVLLSKKNEFIEGGVTFLTTPTEFKLSKNETPDGQVNLPPNHLFLGSYALASNDYQFKLNHSVIGTVENVEKKTTAKYSVLTGAIDSDIEVKFHPTEFQLRAAVNLESNKVYLYILGEPNALTKMKYKIFQPGLPIREYNYPLCSLITFKRPIFGSNALETVSAKCDIEQNSCTIPAVFGMNQSFDITTLLNKEAALCTSYDYEFAKPRHQVEWLGLALKITEPRFIQIIPSSAPLNANTELLDQKIEMPNLFFNYQK